MTPMPRSMVDQLAQDPGERTVLRECPFRASGRVCRALSSKADNKFETISYRLSAAGLPIIDEDVAWIDCDLDTVHEAGDHFIVLGRVHSLAVEHPRQPMLVFKGGFSQISAVAVS